MHSVRSSTAALVALALLPSSAFAAESYEGAWAKTSRESNDPDGATGLTIIGLNVNIDGKPYRRCPEKDGKRKS